MRSYHVNVNANICWAPSSLPSSFPPQTIHHSVLFFLSNPHSSFTCRRGSWLSGPDFFAPPSSSSWWPSRCMWVTPESLITSTTGATCWWGCCREHLLLYSMWVTKTTSQKGSTEEFEFQSITSGQSALNVQKHLYQVMSSCGLFICANFTTYFYENKHQHHHHKLLSKTSFPLIFFIFVLIYFLLLWFISSLIPVYILIYPCGFRLRKMKHGWDLYGSWAWHLMDILLLTPLSFKAERLPMNPCFSSMSFSQKRKTCMDWKYEESEVWQQRRVTWHKPTHLHWQVLRQ